ncbi:hypothetical protein FBU30_010730 [Linnemannia zychae]|nr:hypothetical protein FBU30_010730 [Linnemannia zychae]
MFELIPPTSLLKIYKGCSNCRTQKVKCNGQEPCSRCRTFGLQCQYIVLPNQAAHRIAALAAGGNVPVTILPAPTGAASSNNASTADSSVVFTTSAIATTATASITSTTPIRATRAIDTPAPIVTSFSSSTTTSPISSPTTPLVANSVTNTITSWPTDDLTKSSSRITSSFHSPKSRASKKKRRSPANPRKKSDYGRSESTDSPIRSASPQIEHSSNTGDPAMIWLTSPNAIMQSLIEAADPDLYAYKGPLPSDDVSPSPAVLRELVGYYLQYMHPIHGLVDPQAPDFWTRLDYAMEPQVASIVYAMCTIGAVYKSSTPSPGVRDELIYEFYRRTWTLKDERPRDIVTIQTILIMQSFFDLTCQVDEANSSFRLMAEIADEIGLGTHVLELARREKLTKEDILVRNTWKLLVWNEVMGYMISKQSNKVIPTKDLSSVALDVRPEEAPTLKATIADTVYYYLGNLFKIFQSITRIKLPMSPRDLHAATHILDAFTTWHNSLPKHLRGPSPRTNFSSGRGTISPSAYTLDLYFRLGHILLLNSLPSSVRSSPTGLGPRRESPLRILATCANGITATVGDLIKEPELRNYCMAHGLRCLTEAAMLQLANSKELDPAISTPAKVNFMKTLWCIRQFNFSLPVHILNVTLAPFDTAGKLPSSSSHQDIAQPELSKAGLFRPRTSSVSSVTMDSPVFSAPSRIKRDISLASDHSSSTTSAREGSHPTIFETDEADSKRTSKVTAASPLQDGATTSLLALSLESPTPLQNHTSTALTFTRAPEGVSEGIEVTTSQSLSFLRDDYEGDRSRSSSISVLSLKNESPTAHLVSFTDVQSYPVTNQHSSLPLSARRDYIDPHSPQAQEYRSLVDLHSHPPSPHQTRTDIDQFFAHPSTNIIPTTEGTWTSYDSHIYREAHIHDDGYSPRTPATLPLFTSAGPRWPSDLYDTDSHSPRRSFLYEGDSSMTVTDHLRTSTFQLSPSVHGDSIARISNDKTANSGSTRSLPASERQGASIPYPRHDLPYQYGAPNRLPSTHSHSSHSYPHPKEYEHQHFKEMRLRETQSYGDIGHDIGTYRAKQPVSEIQNPPSRLHSRQYQIGHDFDPKDFDEQDTRRQLMSRQHSEQYLSDGVTLFSGDREREVPIGYQDILLSPSHHQRSEKSNTRLVADVHIEDHTRIGHQYQSSVPHHYTYHRHLIDEDMVSKSSGPSFISMKQPNRGSGDVIKTNSLEQKLSHSNADVGSPQGPISPQSATSRPLGMSSSRSNSRRSSAVIWHDSPNIREGHRERGSGSGPEAPLFAGRKRSSVSMYGTIGDEENARNRGNALVDSGQDVSYQDGPGYPRLSERRVSSVHGMERHEQGVGLGLSGITPPVRYAQPDFPRDQHVANSESILDYQNQYWQDNAPPGRPSSERFPYPQYRSVHPSAPPLNIHTQHDARYFQSQESTGYDSRTQHQRIITAPPHPPRPPTPPSMIYPSQMVQHPEWHSTIDTHPLGPHDSRSKGVDFGEDKTLEYSEIIRDPVRRKYR